MTFGGGQFFKLINNNDNYFCCIQKYEYENNNFE